MPRPVVWQGELLADLFYLSWKEFNAKYPHIKKNTYKGKRNYWKQKIIKGETPMPPSPEGRPEIEGELRKTWEVSAFDRENNEWTTTVNRSYEHQPNLEELVDIYTSLEPAKIRPSRAKREKRLGKYILNWGDGQVDFRRIIDPVTDEQKVLPTHNVPAHRIILQVSADLRPETAVNLGDFADLAALSDFPGDSDHFHKTIGPSMRWINAFYGQMRTDNPDGHLVEVDSNHAVRAKKQILKKIPALHDFVLPGEDYPVLSYYRMANLGKYAIDFYDGYGAAEFVYGEGQGRPIVYKHGNHSSSTPGATVRKEMQQNPEVNVHRGHGHNYEQIMHTTRNGDQLFYIQEGTTCLNRGPVPAYASAVGDRNNIIPNYQDHQTTFSITVDHGNGNYSNIRIPISKDGKAWFMGKEYDGNIPFDWEEDFNYER